MSDFQSPHLRQGYGGQVISNFKNKPVNIILLGDPAAGKATQGRFLVKKFGLYDLDMGKELRKIRTGKSERAVRLRATIDKGNLAPTDIVRAIFQDRISMVPQKKGILFDGNPKMIGEAKLVYKWLKEYGRRDPIVLYLSIPMKETVLRMSSRKEYSGGKLQKRDDDSLEALKNRVKYYRTNIAEVVSFFRSKYEYKRIDGMGTVEEVRERVLLAVHDMRKS